MRFFALALGSLFALSSLALAATDSQSDPAGSSQSGISRRAYPGGRDDSDLTVQTLKKVIAKDEDLDPDQFEPDATDDNSPGSNVGFGE